LGRPDFPWRRRGRCLPAIRAAWILERGDVEAVPGRQLKPEDDGYLSWKHAETAQRATSRNRLVQFDRGDRKVYKGKPGQRPTQLAYAKQGIIAGMEYIAIRENLRLAAQADRPAAMT
jgi:phosphomethylpyrimidine synthase